MNDDHSADYSQITDDIYIGSDLCRGTMCLLHADEFKKLGICTEINLTAEKKEIPPDGIDTYVWIPVVDQEAPSSDQLDIGAAVIHENVQNRNKIYVHCKEGHGRSPTMVASYLIRYQGMNVDMAIDFISKRRSGIHIEDSQREALNTFSKKWLK